MASSRQVLLAVVMALACASADASHSRALSAAGGAMRYVVRNNERCPQTYSNIKSQVFVCKRPVSCLYFAQCSVCGGFKQIACPVKGFPYVCRPGLTFRLGHCFCPVGETYNVITKQCANPCGTLGLACCVRGIRSDICRTGLTCIAGKCAVPSPSSPPPPAALPSPPPPTYGPKK